MEEDLTLRLTPSDRYNRHYISTMTQVNHTRILRLQALMQSSGIDAMVLSSNVALLYVFGQIYSGLVYLPQSGEPLYLVRRPQTYSEGKGLHHIRKIEQLADLVDLGALRHVALELDELSYSEVMRQSAMMPHAQVHNATQLLRTARMVKTSDEIEAIRATALRHVEVYKTIPSLYRKGMTDVELQIEIERSMRLHGSTGVFRTFGSSMEIHMGSLLAGDNALAPSPYDFAMGGEGSVALPLGSNGTRLCQGQSVMIDMAGNYGVYLSDMTRTYSIGTLPDEALRLHALSQHMHLEVMQAAKPGTSCADLYTRCVEMAKEAGADQYFMGYGQQAQFVGHGLGLQINELPVLTARSRDLLQEGMVIAFEPKFVLPGVGAVGIENTYLVTADGVENLTPFTEDIIPLV